MAVNGIIKLHSLEQYLHAQEFLQLIAHSTVV
jgi:hypothetical protein